MTVLIDYTKGFFETTEGDGVGTNPATIGDLNFANVELLMHFDGSNGSTTFTDSSKNNFSFTANGDPALSTSVKKFGTASGYFDGTGDGLELASNAAFDFGSGDFTIESWVYFNTTGLNQHLMGWRTTGGATNTNWLLQCNSANVIKFWASNGSSYFVNAMGTFTISTSTWYHVTVTRSGSSFKMFVDGTEYGTATSSDTISSTSRPFQIGLDPASGVNRLNGYLDEMRITKGVARYTSNFTAPTAAFLDAGPTLDLSTGSVFTHTPSANVAYAFTNPPASGTSSSFTLKVTPSATITVTWPSSVIWSGGTTPTVPANGETDVYTFYTDDGGTTYYGFQVGDAVA